jgi:tartrate-resistant acid phosphatase type 5
MFDRRTVLKGAAALWLAASFPVQAAQAAPSPLSFLAVGDWGRRGRRDQQAVAAAMAQTAAEVNSRFVLSAGDNFYPAGVKSADDPQWKRSFEDVYTASSLQTPWYAALGNHDYRGKPSAQVAYARTSVRWRMPERYYRIDDPAAPAELDLFVLDTTPITGGRSEGLARFTRGRLYVPDRAPQLAWFEAQLAASQAPWKVVVGHHPIYSGGRHGGSSELKDHVEPLLAKYGVQAYICGHDHALQHIQVGVTNHVCTGSGSSAGGVRTIKGTQFAMGEPGFALFTLSAGTLRLAFRGSDGRTLYETALPRTAA